MPDKDKDKNKYNNGFRYDRYEKENYMDELDKYMNGRNKKLSDAYKDPQYTYVRKKTGDAPLPPVKKKKRKKRLLKKILRRILGVSNKKVQPQKNTPLASQTTARLYTLKHSSDLQSMTKQTPKKAQKKMKKRSRRFIFLRRVAIGIIIPVAVLLYIDQVYLAQSNSNPYKNAVTSATITDIPATAKWIGFSADNTSYMYINDNALYIKYIKDQSMRKTLIDSNHIVAAVPMEDRNIVLYFTIEKNVSYTEQIKTEQAQKQYDPESADAKTSTQGTSSTTGQSSTQSASSGTSQSSSSAASQSTQSTQTVTRVTDILRVKTYNMDTGDSTDQQSIKISNFESVEQVEYSSKTNVIYLKLGAKGTKSDMNYIYRINIMKTVTLFSSAPKLGNMGILSTEDSLYYEYNSSIFYNWNVISDLKDQKPKLLECAGDTAYIASGVKPTIIYKYKGTKRDGEITVADSTYKLAYHNRGKVYLVYDTYMIELTGNTSDKISFENSYKFLAISNGVLYTQSSTGTVKSKKF